MLGVKNSDFISKGDYNASVIVTSDTCFKNPSLDLSGQYVVDELKHLNFKTVSKRIVEDDLNSIRDCLKQALADKKTILVITVGGTGLCPRDVTPEATSALYDKQCNGIVAGLYSAGLRYNSHAALSRLTAGVAGTCLIINFPGKLQACKECLDFLIIILEHGLEQIVFSPDSIRETHIKQQQTFEKRLENLMSRSGNSPEPSVVKVAMDAKSKVQSTFQLKKVQISESPDRSSTQKIQQSHPVTQTIKNEVKVETDSIKKLSLHSPYPMVEFQEALDIMKSLSKHLCKSKEVVTLATCDIYSEVIGRHLGEDIHSKTVIPPYPCSTMDGYVLNVHPSFNQIIESINTVQADLVSNLEEFERLQNDRIKSNSFFCYQINTGARVPHKNFTIIPVEYVTCINSQHVSIIDVYKHMGNYIRKPGVDLNSGDKIKRGSRIGPVELALILSMGHDNVKLYKRPYIGLFSTGDELVSFQDKMDQHETGKAIDTNRPLLTTLFRSKHYSVLDQGIAKDRPSDIQMKIQTAFMLCDVVVVTGGASMGSKDHVKDVIEKMGGTIHYGRVNMKPGKPVAFASIEYGGSKKFIFSLPGNPVSAYITTLTLVIPFIEHGLRCRNSLEKMSLLLSDIGDIITVEIVELINDEQSGCCAEYKFDGRMELVRGQIVSIDRKALEGTEIHKVKVTTRQQSSCLVNLLHCDCLLIVEPTTNHPKLAVGQRYRALRLSYSNF